MESHLKADGPKCVVLAFLCCPDPYYCLILDSQFSLFFLFFGLWFDWIYVVSCVLAESEGGVLIFECNQEYTNDPQWFSILCLEKGQYNTPWSISFQGKMKFSMASCMYILHINMYMTALLTVAGTRWVVPSAACTTTWGCMARVGGAAARGTGERGNPLIHTHTLMDSNDG